MKFESCSQAFANLIIIFYRANTHLSHCWLCLFDQNWTSLTELLKSQGFKFLKFNQVYFSLFSQGLCFKIKKGKWRNSTSCCIVNLLKSIKLHMWQSWNPHFPRQTFFWKLRATLSNPQAENLGVISLLILSQSVSKSLSLDQHSVPRTLPPTALLLH